MTACADVQGIQKKTEAEMFKEFIFVILDKDISFLRYALIAGLLGSIPLGISGSFVVSRNISAIAGAIAHAVLGGVGLALYLNRVMNLSWMTPLAGAMLGAFAAALLIYFASLHAGEKEDTVISAVWALGMSIGLLFIAKTPGYVDLQGYLFGNILLVTKSDLYMVMILSGLVTILTAIFFRPLQTMLFDSEFARLRGINVNALYFLLLLLVAMTVVLMVNIAGIILLIALLSLPAATAKCFVRSLASMMTVAILLAMMELTLGLYVSFSCNLPTGPLAVLIAVIFYIIARVKVKLSKFRNRKNV